MNLIEAVILGLIQGATEFLPISSSGHLILVPSLFDLPEPGLNLVAFVHLGTLVAVIVYFRSDLWKIVRAVFAGLRRGKPLFNSEARLGWYIVVGSLPAAAAGLALGSVFEEVFGTPLAAAMFLIGTAALLIVGERLLAGDKADSDMNWLDAIVIGLAQMFALLPGISRSGSTIAAGLWRGLDRTTAARYSFLLGVPAILGAGLLALLDILESRTLTEQLPTLMSSFVSSSLSGYACIRFLLNWLQQRSLYAFAIYCLLFALISLAITLTN